MSANYNELLTAIKEAAKEQMSAMNPCDIMQGTVRSSAPLTIQVDQKFTLDVNNLIIPRSLTSYRLIINGSSVVVDNSLQAGEKVILMRQQGGQKYLVVDKVG